ncbi:CPBP family intramembrane metalloprotease [Nonomuraea sp. KC401]|uniref:CPBP family intramembrane glutamic endopeptidase n=1 Tax=unclassified Nonomuraea TaxID=2593643 RepID=UPI0010FD13F6|nr:MULTISPECIES: CPBP family intramembrane glutamic endopeptidase [unclassified Nonomuraea]NBE99678.1 CPBP family intramembrane metalloprotease [Nonomuraea sp. K271]TLF57145.1 CPBP family intramembrane metalloprotease [Nonomuraea sp. KC401]
MNRPLPIFIVLAFGLSWAAALPLWLGGGLGSPLMPLLATVMMFTPTAALLGVWAVTRTPSKEWARTTGLTLGGSRKRTGLIVAATWLGVPLLAFLAMGLSAAAGLVALDLDRLSLLRAALEARGMEIPADLGTVAALQIVVAILAGPLLNAIPALGEEWGWRGWLLPRLTSTNGVLAGLLLSGAIWGLWHAPLTLLGYNYPSLGSWAALFFIGFCVLAGVLFGWLRLRTGSVWPAVVAHGSLNAVVPPVLLLGDDAAPPNELLVGLTGLVGWVVLALAGAALLRFFPVRQEPPAQARPVAADARSSAE